MVTNIKNWIYWDEQKQKTLVYWNVMQKFSPFISDGCSEKTVRHMQVFLKRFGKSKLNKFTALPFSPNSQTKRIRDYKSNMDQQIWRQKSGSRYHSERS